MQLFPPWQTDFYLFPYYRQGGAAIILILISAEVSYFLLLLYHWKIFHTYLQGIADSESIRKTGSPAVYGLGYSQHIGGEPRINPTLLVVALHKSALQKNRRR